jgi:hypothetical protein
MHQNVCLGVIYIATPRQMVDFKMTLVRLYLTLLDFSFLQSMTCANPSESTYTLHLPNKPNCFPTFHSSLLHKFIDNDHTLFSACSLVMPGTIITAEGEEWLVKLE